ncbi:copper oxidase (laccase) domain-containing protein [Paracidovorax wautersii]|uniref:Copper oxidase (Laccase) domain-containing protein n=1 Tax=Paracidovorax wautersii TaxID=1177982 RepID=A0ABU1IEM5_9BURK|nr:copper oxidase (laccase) domain-containing protein [Paracidovorax wautersii]
MPRPDPVPEYAAAPADWLRPDWPAPARVHALCTTRAGGVSAPPYDALNLGDHVHDDPQAVAANRAVLARALAAPGTALARPVFLRQVHGCDVVPLQSDMPDGTAADACTATAPGVACTIMVADCLPVLFTDRQGTRVAAAHAGWRGLAGTGGRGVLEAVLESFEPLAPMDQAQHAINNEAVGAAHAGTLGLMAWLGPCIGPNAFEVGPEVHAAFCGHDPAADAFFAPQGAGKFLADLAGLARHRLRALGVTAVYGNDSSAAWCTVGQPSRFFSHRRDTAALGGSGRFAACIWLGDRG